MLIRDALASDAPAIARVQVLSWRATYRDIIAPATLAALSEQHLTRSWLHWLFSRQAGTLCRVLVDDSATVIGYAMGSRARDLPGEQTGVAEIQVLYLRPETTRRGYGQQLMAAMARGFDRLGYQQLHIWSLDENPSRPFYDRLDGKVQSTRLTTLRGQSLREVLYVWPTLTDLIDGRSVLRAGRSTD